MWRAYQASWVYWFIGLFTAFLTSFYMFRLWFMTFFGEYRGSGEDSHQEAGARYGALRHAGESRRDDMGMAGFMRVRG